jgi:hypothetical protein
MEVVSAAEASTEVVSAVVDSGSTADSDAASDMGAASDMDAASDFMVAIPTFMAGMGTAAVRTTTARTDAIEQHGMLLHWLAVAVYSGGVAHDSRTGHLAGKPGMARLMAARNSQVTGNKTGAPASLVFNGQMFAQYAEERKQWHNAAAVMEKPTLPAGSNKRD